MTEITETNENNPKTRENIEPFVLNCSNESYRTRTQRGKIGKKIHKEAVEKVNETIENKDKKLNWKMIKKS